MVFNPFLVVVTTGLIENASVILLSMPTEAQMVKRFPLLVFVPHASHASQLHWQHQRTPLKVSMLRRPQIKMTMTSLEVMKTPGPSHALSLVSIVAMSKLSAMQR